MERRMARTHEVIADDVAEAMDRLVGECWRCRFLETAARSSPESTRPVGTTALFEVAAYPTPSAKDPDSGSEGVLDGPSCDPERREFVEQVGGGLGRQEPSGGEVLPKEAPQGGGRSAGRGWEPSEDRECLERLASSTTAAALTDVETVAPHIET